MKFVMFSLEQGDERLGAIINEDQLLDLTKSGKTPEFASLIALIESADTALEQARSLVASSHGDALVDSSTTRLLAPLSSPPQMGDLVGFEEHLAPALELGCRPCRRSGARRYTLREPKKRQRLP